MLLLKTETLQLLSVLTCCTSSSRLLLYCNPCCLPIAIPASAVQDALTDARLVERWYGCRGAMVVAVGYAYGYQHDGNS